MYNTVADENVSESNSISPVRGSVDVMSVLYLNSNASPPKLPACPVAPSPPVAPVGPVAPVVPFRPCGPWPPCRESTRAM
jgi:hypothetical protein